MSQYPHVIQKLINQLAKLPTIGPKTAERIVFTLLKKNQQNIVELGQGLIDLGQQVSRCSSCRNYTTSALCSICADEHRDTSLLCIVAEPQDLEAIERTNTYQGRYFILNGTISTYHGTGPQEIQVPELMQKIKNSPTPVAEVILALDPDIEGETTMMYLAKALQPLGVKISRLARGLPVGADLEYADEITLTEALTNRSAME